MVQEPRRTGRCLCGEVRIEVTSKSNAAGACHCGMCRRWGGGPLLAVGCGSDVQLQGTDKISVFDSSEWAERGFCSVCGTHIFYRLKEGGEYAVPAGVLDDQDWMVFETQLFIDRKPSFYSFANETENLTEAQVYEKYVAPQE